MQVRDKTNLYIPDNLSKILKKYSTCGWTPSGAMTISDRIIETEKVKVNIEQCEDAFDDSIFAESLKQGVNIDDLRDTVILDILRRRFMDAVRTDIPRIQWFAKAGAGNTDYDHFDGWLQRAFDVSGQLSQLLEMKDDPNIEVSNVDDTLVTDGALTAFRTLWKGQSKTLRRVSRENKSFRVSDSVMDNYLDTLEDTQNSEGQKTLENGKTVVKFRGVLVEEVPGWDTNLEDSDNPQQAVIGDNLIVLTIPENLIVGSDVNNPENEVKIRFSEDDER